MTVMTSETLRTISIRQMDAGPTLSCLICGEKPRFLFVHGANSSVVTWLPVMTALASLGESCIAVDLRGHGQSGGKENLQRYRIDDYVADVISVLDEYPSARTLIGHSMGGLIGQRVATRVLLDRLILVASSPVGGMIKDGFRMVFRHPATFLAVFLRRSFVRLYQKQNVAKSLLFHSETPDQVVEQYLANLQEESWMAGNQMSWLLPNPRRITCPVSVIGGSSDAMVCPASISATAGAYGVAPVFIDRSAHMVPIEAEPRKFAKLLLRCSEQKPSEDSRSC
jgi:pimeloyl-ACP methyl ester carboxylesterase